MVHQAHSQPDDGANLRDDEQAPVLQSEETQLMTSSMEATQQDHAKEDVVSGLDNIDSNIEIQNGVAKTARTLTLEELKDYFYNLVINDPLSPECTREQCEALSPFPEMEDLPSLSFRGIPWPDLRHLSKPVEESFSLFPKLPKELRLQIWEYSLPPPRLVWLEVEWGSETHYPIEDVLWDERIPVFKCDDPSSFTSLHGVCQESRCVLSTNYHRLEFTLGDTIRHGSRVERMWLARGIRDHLPSGLALNFDFLISPYIDCSRDTLLMSPRTKIELEAIGLDFQLSPFKNFALGLPGTQLGEQFIPQQSVQSWGSLRSFTVVLNCPDFPFRMRRENGRIPHLTEIESEWQYLEVGDGDHTLLTSEYVEPARLVRRRYKEYAKTTGGIISSISKADVSFEVSLLSWEHPYDFWYHETVHLPPFSIGADDIVYTPLTWRPMEVCYDPVLCLSANLYIFPSCSKEGQVIHPYDGVAELFREEVELKQGSEQTNQRDEWTKYGGVVVTKSRGDHPSMLYWPWC